MLSALEMSRRYKMYLATQLAGDETEGVDFGLWLDTHWCDEVVLSDEPCAPDACDEIASSGVIAWSELDDEIIGLLTGRARGCYRIPRDARPPLIALMLDDAEGCSTGSVYQERGFIERRDLVLEAPVTISRPPRVADPSILAEIPLLPIPDALPPVTPDAGL